MIEELQKKYDDLKGVIDVLPVNTKYNRKRKVDYLLEEIENDNKRLESIRKEIENRISKFKTYAENPRINELETEKTKCNIVNEWNNYNTAYEKMHLDYYLYQLHRYYKDDLTSVNTCIKKIVSAFKKVEISLSKDDFDFNFLVSNYMEKVINGASDNELEEAFEEIYWKNADIVKIIEINFKSIYLRNEKKINKYYEDRHEEFLKTHQDFEIYEMRINLGHEIKRLKLSDIFLNFNNFVSGKYSVNEFKKDDIEKKKEVYFDGDSYNLDNLEELYSVLNEYNVLLKYKYIFDDMKDKLAKKEELKTVKANALKEITKLESDLKKLNDKQYKKPLLPFLKPKNNDEKWLFEYKEVLNNLIDKYNEFDSYIYDDLICNKLSQDSSIYDVLRLVISNYLYFVKMTLKLDEEQDVSLINDKFEELKNYVNENRFVLLTNVALLDERQMKQLIVDKYNLGKIKLTVDNLLDDNIDKTIADINQLINYENMVQSGLNIDDVSLYLEYQKLIPESSQ